MLIAAATTVTIAVVAAAAAILGPLLTYVVAMRKLSGKVATSEAADLWAESKAIREEYRERLAHADVRVRDLEARVAALEKDNSRLGLTNFELVRELAECKAQIVVLNARLKEARANGDDHDAHLEEEIARLEAQIAVLEAALAREERSR